MTLLNGHEATAFDRQRSVAACRQCPAPAPQDPAAINAETPIRV